MCVPHSLFTTLSSSRPPLTSRTRVAVSSSRAGGLSDDNGKMDPARLAVWTSIGVNYSTYKPTDKQILERYLLKFSKGGTAKMHEDDLGLLDPDSTADGDADDSVYVQVADE